MITLYYENNFSKTFNFAFPWIKNSFMKTAFYKDEIKEEYYVNFEYDYLVKLLTIQILIIVLRKKRAHLFIY